MKTRAPGRAAAGAAFRLLDLPAELVEYIVVRIIAHDIALAAPACKWSATPLPTRSRCGGVAFRRGQLHDRIAALDEAKLVKCRGRRAAADDDAFERLEKLVNERMTPQQRVAALEAALSSLLV